MRTMAQVVSHNHYRREAEVSAVSPPGQPLVQLILPAAQELAAQAPGSGQVGASRGKSDNLRYDRSFHAYLPQQTPTADLLRVGDMPERLALCASSRGAQHCSALLHRTNTPHINISIKG